MSAEYKTVAVIQARMGSSRLPGKVMLPLFKDVSALEVVVRRAQAAKLVDMVVVATTHRLKDFPIVQLCKAKRWGCLRGSEENVLGRVYATAHAFDASVVVDITSDCPLIDPAHIDAMVARREQERRDYVSNVVERSWPDGLDVQVYARAALTKLISLACEGEIRVNREHSGWNFLQYPDLFDIVHCPAPHKYRRPEWGLTLDTMEDLLLLRRLFAFMGSVDFPVEAALDYVIQNPHVLKFNEHIKRKVPHV